VKQEAKVMYLLECLQKTPPPVLVFSAKKGDVDDMYEYLLLKGVEAVAIHGGKDQDERDLAINSFKEGRKDVLVATDVASKGLDFPHIQHVRCLSLYIYLFVFRLVIVGVLLVQRPTILCLRSWRAMHPTSPLTHTHTHTHTHAHARTRSTTVCIV